MQYMLLIYQPEQQLAAMSEAQRREFMADYTAFTNEVKDAGAMVAADALDRTSTATTVRVRDAKRTITDGPFAETAEALGGYYLIEAEDLDAAIAWAAKIPSAKFGSIEVRPIMQW